MNLGSLLSGAGAVSEGMRDAEEAERRAREQQLQIEQLNRLEKLRRAQTAVPLDFGSPSSIAESDRLGVLPARPKPAATAASTAPAPSKPLSPVAPRPSLLDRALRPTPKKPGRGVDEPPPGMGTMQARPGTGAPGTGNMFTPQEQETMRLRDMQRRQAEEMARGIEVTATRLTPGVFATDANEAIANVLGREGGYVNDPDDVGGETKFGISKRAFPDLDIANLTEEDAARIYKTEYWDAIGADNLPENIREIAFDAAVNQGVSAAKEMLTQSGGDPEQFLQLREQKYRALVASNPKQRKFLNGWLARLDEFRGGTAGVTATAAPAMTASTTTETESPANYYLANPNAINYDRQVALQQRSELVRLAKMYQDAGLGNEYMQARASIMQADASLYYLQGMQGLSNFEFANDPSLLGGVLSFYTGNKVNIQPYADNTFDILVNGQVAYQGLGKAAVADIARLQFDSGYRQQQSAASAELNQMRAKALFDAQTKLMEIRAQMEKDIRVEGLKKQADILIERFKAQNKNYDIQKISDEVVIITPPGGQPYMFNINGTPINIGGDEFTTFAAQRITGFPRQATGLNTSGR